MYTQFIKVLALFSMVGTAYAQGPETPTETETQKTTIIQMDGKHFCSILGSEHPAVCNRNQDEKRIVMLRLKPLDSDTYQPWALRLYFGNANTFYRPTDMRVQTSRLDITMHGVEGRQRNNYDYFRFWDNGGLLNCLQWIDEPTNNLKIVFDRNNNQFFLSVNHPKVVYINHTSQPNLNQSVLVNGTVDGVPINGYVNPNPQFDGYNTQPGELNITKHENSWMWMQYEVGYGYAIPLIQSQKAGRIVFTPQVQAGIVTGPTNSSIMQKGQYWEHDKYISKRSHLMGFTVTPAARLEWQSPHQKIGLFAEYRYSTSVGKLQYPFLDGKISHDLRYQSITFGISSAIRLKKKH